MKRYRLYYQHNAHLYKLNNDYRGYKLGQPPLVTVNIKGCGYDKLENAVEAAKEFAELSSVCIKTGDISYKISNIGIDVIIIDFDTGKIVHLI